MESFIRKGGSLSRYCMEIDLKNISHWMQLSQPPRKKMEWTEFNGKIPPHMSCEISHNQHKNYYHNIEEHLNNLSNGDRPPIHVLSEEEYNRCIETDQLWKISWYPITPIGFNVVYAPTLQECFAKIENGKWV